MLFILHLVSRLHELIPVEDLNIFVCDGVGEIRRKELDQKSSARCPDVYNLCVAAPWQSVEPPSPRREKKDVHLSTVQWPLHAHLITKKKTCPFFFYFIFLVLLEHTGLGRSGCWSRQLCCCASIFYFVSYAREQIVIFHHHQLAGSLISFFSESLHCRSRSPDQRK